jgi:hypothetical protein
MWCGAVGVGVDERWEGPEGAATRAGEDNGVVGAADGDVGVGEGDGEALIAERGEAGEAGCKAGY